MKIKNYGGRSWISKYTTYKGVNEGLTIHIVNAEVEEAEVKGSMLVIKVKK